MTPVETLRAAARTSSDMFNRVAVRIGDESIGGCADCGVDAEIDTPELAALLAGLLNAREPLAALLDAVADEIRIQGGALTEAELARYAPMVPTWPAALAVARAILRSSS